MTKSETIHEHNRERELAESIVCETACHLFLTGRAGTGKTTFLRQLAEHCPKRMVILAPTGIAAINAGGATIHSFLQLPFGLHLPGQSYERSHFRFSKRKLKLIRSLELLVIDEISMVRADLLDLVDITLRRLRASEHPFGGLQVLMIGDLQQLPPVADEGEWQILSKHYDTPYFFSAQVLKESPLISIELQQVYRQSDSHFLALLNEVRSGLISEEGLAALNERYIRDFNPTAEEGYIRLCTHNHQAERINHKELAALTTPTYRYTALIEGKYPEGAYPNALELELRVGAQVMFIKNGSSAGQSYYNGMLGEVSYLDEEGVRVRPLDGSTELYIGREAWSFFRYEIDEESAQVQTIEEGRFEQIPLRLAWAITIHKSQGLTFDRAIIDVQSAFTHGQTYVALSRCRSLEGLVLSQKLGKEAIIQDASVRNFAHGAEGKLPSTAEVESLKRSYYLQLVSELFGFGRLESELKRYVRLLQEHYYRQHGEGVEAYTQYALGFAGQVIQVAESFAHQYRALITEEEDYSTSPLLQERLRKAATYFETQLAPLEALMRGQNFTSNNKEVKKRHENITESLGEELRQKLALLNYIQREGFVLPNYLHARAKAIIGETLTSKEPSKTKRASKTRSTKSVQDGSPRIEKPEKPAEPSTLEQSYTLLKSGLSIEEIALQRGLKPSTIEQHATKLVLEGRLPFGLFICEEERDLLASYINKQEELAGIKDIYEGLEGRLSYFKLRIALEEAKQKRLTLGKA